MSGTSSVHTIETSERLPLPSSYRAYRIGLNPDLYEKANQLYSAVDAVDYTSYIDRLDSCRSRSWFARHKDTGKVRVFTTTCKLRWCPMCVAARRAWLQGSIGEWLKGIEQPKFLTLTIKHNGLPLSLQIKNLYTYFKNLRRSAFWRRKVAGGVWFFQLKKSDTDELWHPHLHCVLDSDWMLHETLSGLWNEITHGSPIVDIKIVRNPEKSADYVARYATAPANLIHLDTDDAVDCFRSLHGRRICGKFGTAEVIHLRPPKCDDKDEWQHVGGWSVVTQCADSHPAALLILQAWQSNSVLAPSISMYDLEYEIRNGFKRLVDDGPFQYNLAFYDTS